MAPSANLTNEDLFALIVLKIGNLSAKHGNSLYSPVGYAAYSLVLGSVLGDFQKAKKVEEISLSMVEIIDDEALKCTTYFVIGTFINHWTSPVRQSFNYLQKSFDCGMRSGEFFYSGFTVASMTEMQYSMGVPLQELKRFLELHRRYGKKMNHDNLLRLIRIFTDHIRELTAADFSLVDRLIDEEEISKLNTMEGMTYYLLKLQRLYLEGSIEEAYYLSQKTIKQLDSVRGYFLQVDFVFYFLLLNLEKKKHQKDFPESRDEKIFLKYRKKLQNWAEMSPENHGGKHLLIEALSRSLSKQKQDVVQLYDEAIEHAKTKHNLLLEALGNYLAADYYRSNRKIERVFARDACQLFNQWGSEKTANRIGKLYEINDYFAVDAESIVGTAAEIDDDTGSQKKISSEQRLQDCQKDLEVLELEAAYKYFLNTICKEAKADLGVILLEKEDQIRLEYMWQYGEETFSLAGIEIEELENLPKKVFRYAGRTYEKVIIESKPKEGPFANDDYIGDRAEISIICLPLKYNDIFVGLIYLESQNNYQFNPMIAKYIKRLSFYLVAKHALEKGSEKSAKMFTNNTVNEQLTNREVEVLYYMAEGMSNKEIANKLYISLSTVKTHTLNIYGKLEVSSRVQAVTKAKKLGLV
jgi:DNA-binding CsgD family transcriptional regulator